MVEITNKTLSILKNHREKGIVQHALISAEVGGALSSRPASSTQFQDKSGLLSETVSSKKGWGRGKKEGRQRDRTKHTDFVFPQSTSCCGFLS